MKKEGEAHFSLGEAHFSLGGGGGGGGGIYCQFNYMIIHI